ncbi:hypothetical protein Kpol_538p38 [Vanderwaltozyma polyspora DSM 70294]|uniref:Glycine cleavage system H protein n=1 Tax=Vanderwaltozyma polyspora (strain ATCC 22028 / DSM 70294 / BCRC 21397 / CBS 2163 / NBRC 10782 / NRRL Y-8283 / UCD 57-17) TaxID=436907 RepID=A7TKF1_VANPO|nr:uncharacterized protein Kpol_538p38 [Vanderwaltozyma polyspora DSM 70294]EDO17278.1 hypothetical protein Kpol_538p38 [Vanderwaltozyma polyspora DSM 70294]
MFSRIARTSLQKSSLRLFLRAQSTNTLTKTQLPFTYSASGPSFIKYTNEHEWIAAHEDGTAFLGITKYAADALGDATYVELPEPETEVEAGESISSIESVKSASEIYQPVAGTIIEGNEQLSDSPQLINEDPLGAGWIAKIKLKDIKDLESGELFSIEQYENFLKEDAH